MRLLYDLIEIKFYKRGEYLFRKGDKADNAYVLLYGQLIFLDVQSTSYLSNAKELKNILDN
jgi:CRP-like cAMP-binding protein